MTDAVAAMCADDHAPTAPLDEFLVAYREDDNLWWRVACGHHQNLFEAAVDRLAEATKR